MYEQPTVQDNVVTERSEKLLPNTDKIFPEYTNEAKEDAEEGKEDKMYEPGQKDEEDWAEHTPMIKEMLKAPEVEIPQSTLPMQTSTLSMEDKILPVIMSSKHTAEKEGKIEEPGGQDVGSDGQVKVKMKRAHG